MLALTKDQHQIGEVLEEGNRFLTSKDTHLTSEEEQDVRDQMKVLNRRWESLRAKSLDRQAKYFIVPSCFSIRFFFSLQSSQSVDETSNRSD